MCAINNMNITIAVIMCAINNEILRIMSFSKLGVSEPCARATCPDEARDNGQKRPESSDQGAASDGLQAKIW